MDPTSHRRTLAALLAFGTILAVPFAGALAFGLDADSLPAARTAGASPRYGQLWVGEWMEWSGWGGHESAVRALRDSGTTPVVMWYYWGDGISVDAVKYGKDGRSKSEWDAMAREMAKRTRDALGDREFLVVIEPEFNKNGVQDWETFDGYLADQAYAIKGVAPRAKVVMGFGHWGGWDAFDRAMGASEYSGFQMLRGSTRDSAAKAENVADDLLAVTKALKARFGKDVFLYDFGISTYGGWEGVQETALARLTAKLGDLERAGLKGIVWRYLKDNTHSSGYFGAAEHHWGVLYSWGGKKRGFDELVALLGGGSAPSASVSASSSSAAASPFSDVSGNEWWVQARVGGSPTWVAARVNDGGWVTLPKQSWGAHAASLHAPRGSVVELRADYAGGITRTTKYAWPDAAPAAAAGAFDATFAGVKGNQWWLQADVRANEPLAKVEARVDGGAWVPLQKQSWGAWAASFRIPAGSKVELQAISTGGATDRSTSYAW